MCLSEPYTYRDDLGSPAAPFSDEQADAVVSGVGPQMLLDVPELSTEEERRRELELERRIWKRLERLLEQDRVNREAMLAHMQEDMQELRKGIQELARSQAELQEKIDKLMPLARATFVRNLHDVSLDFTLCESVLSLTLEAPMLTLRAQRTRSGCATSFQSTS